MRRPCTVFPTTNKCHENSQVVQGPQEEEWMDQSIFKKELMTFIDSGTLNIKEQRKPNDIVLSTADANKIKLDQDGPSSKCEFV
jgi:hypothetical protein